VGQAAYTRGELGTAVEALGRASAILGGGPAYGIVWALPALVADLWHAASLAAVGRFDEAIARAQHALAAAEDAQHLYTMASA
jgi:hypothetical protein